MLLANSAARIVFLICAFYTSPAAADYSPEFEPVVRIFSGLSFADHEMIRSATTQDFLLLEAGEGVPAKSCQTVRERANKLFFRDLSGTLRWGCVDQLLEQGGNR